MLNTIAFIHTIAFTGVFIVLGPYLFKIKMWKLLCIGFYNLEANIH